MVDRMQLGLVPAKPHTVHRVDGELTFEECFTRQGFDGAYSVLYHRRHPARSNVWEPAPENRSWRAASEPAPLPDPARPLGRLHARRPRSTPLQR
jgi:homogentisate 1,2-dioxygenase